MGQHRVLPSQEVLRELLSYDAETGKLQWRHRSDKWFTPTDGRTAAHAASNWNAIWAGKHALESVHIAGYRCGTLLSGRVLAHRVIWALVHGAAPQEIDHLNGDRADNRLVNLRPVTHASNMKNTKRRSDNTSGVVGVFWKRLERKWAASIGVDGREFHLGVFPTIEEATAVRRAAEAAHGYHANHGRC